MLLTYWRISDQEIDHENDENDDNDKNDFIVAIISMQKEKKFILSRNRKEFFKRLTLLERRIRYKKIPRSCLHSIQESAWRKLYSGKRDSALITLTGLSHSAFQALNTKFKKYFENLSPFSGDGSIRNVMNISKKGRPRNIKSEDCLALNLAWTRTRGGIFVLSLIFGMTTTAVSIYLKFWRRILIEILCHEKKAKVKIPSDDEIRGFKEIVAQRHPSLRNVWMTMDGLKLYLEQSPSTVIQNQYYNGWKSDRYVRNVLDFCPTGTIVVAATNIPGCVHDSMVADCEKLQNFYERTGGMCG